MKITGFSFSGGVYFSRLMNEKIKSTVRKRDFDADCLKALQDKLNKGETLSWVILSQYTQSNKDEELFFDQNHLTFS